MLNQLTKLLFSSNPSTIDTQTIVYNFNKGQNLSVTGDKENASILLKYFFASISCLISKPLFTISPTKVIIHLCYYKPKGLNRESGKIKVDNSNLKPIGYMLNRIFNKPVELELIPLRYPYHDSNILAQLIALNSKKYNFNRMVQKLFKKATIITKTYSSLNTTHHRTLSIWSGEFNSSLAAPAKSNSLPATQEGVSAGLEGGKNSHTIAPNSNEALISPISQLTGIKVTIAGRLTTQRIVPKSTVKTAYKGHLSSSSSTGGKITKNFIDSATYTSKNKIGAYTVRVQLGHKISN